MSLEPVRHAVVVPLAPEAAFDLFTRGIARWWPFAGHSCAGEAGTEGVLFEPRAGGAVTEVGRDGSRHPWGVLTSWQPPHGFSMTWHPAQPVTHATALAVRFTAVDGGCEVAIEHTGFEVLGEAVRRNYDQGWPYVLGCLSKAVAA